MNTNRLAPLAARCLAAVLLAGCALPETRVAPQEPVRIARIERLHWNAPPEPNLFRVEFGPLASREIRRRAAFTAAQGDSVASVPEFALMERESEAEFKSKGHCAEGGRAVSIAEGAADSPLLTAFFRCRPKPLF